MLLEDKKAQEKNISGMLLGIVIVAILLVAFVPIVLSGFNEFSQEDACFDADPTCSFNNPSGFCAINSSSEGSGIACGTTPRESLPLGVLFTVVLGVILAIGAFGVIRKSLKV